MMNIREQYQHDFIESAASIVLRNGYDPYNHIGKEFTRYYAKYALNCLYGKFVRNSEINLVY